MKILLKRTDFTDKSTIGTLSIDDQFFSYTLEDVVREGEKVPGKTAIPQGTFRVTMNYSNRFKKLMPQILDVPGFEGIRIHAGNTAEHTEGCILLGNTKGKDFVGDSKTAVNKFYGLVDKAVQNKEDVWITIC